MSRADEQHTRAPGALLAAREALAAGLTRRRSPHVFLRNLRATRALGRASILLNDYNSLLGMTWSILGPLSLWAVLYAIFRTRFGTAVPSYPLFLIIGIVIINFFVAATTLAMNSLRNNRDLALSSLVLPEVIVFAELTRHVLKLLVELSLCVIASAWLGMVSARVLLALPLIATGVLMTVGVALVLALFRCWLGDLTYLWSLVSRLLLFATPVIYDLEDISERAAMIVYWGNPLTPFLSALRSCLVGSTPFDPWVYAHALLSGITIFVLGYGSVLLFEQRTVERL